MTPSRRAVRYGTAAVVGLALCGSAWALGLGRISLQSVRGEALRAEVEITSLSAEEAAGLSARIAPAEAFERAGAAYNPALAGVQVSLQRRSDGRPVLRISSEQPVQESFLDLIVELSWPSGRATREYTLLFDVPRAVAEAPAARSAPLLGAAPAAAPASEPTPATAPAAATPRSPAPAADAGRYAVKRGDTLSGVASRLQPEGVSLEQMLVALFRGNPHAFVGQNMNRLRADAVLRVPTPEQAGQVARGQARQVVRIQSADFDAYRQRLAQSAPRARVEETERRAGGAVEAAVEERRTAPAAPDRLRLSRGQDAQEAALAREAERREQSQRVAELSRNVDELKKLGAGSPQAAREVTAPTPAPAPASAPVADAAPASAPALAAEAPAAVASAAEPASAPPAAVAAASAASAPADAGPAAAQAASGFQRWSWVLAALGGVAALALLGFGLFKWRRRAKAAAETSFLESRLQPESFFGGSGGQQVDTRESGSGTEPSQYSLSQLDAIGDVDPVAEADVYLAYGRDLQAEEILKEALRGNPQRLAIRTKLLEVYAKRHDTRAFELLAQQLFQITQGQGEDWAKARELGLSIDPENPLYAGAEADVDATAGRAPASEAPSSWLPSRQESAAPAPAPQAEGLDLDLGFLESMPPPSPEPARPLVAEGVAPTPAQPVPVETPLRPAVAAAAAAAAAVSVLPDDAALERDTGPVTRPADEEDALSELDFGASTPAPAPQPPAAAPSLPFDLDALSLDLDEPSTAAVLEELKLSDFGEDADPMQRKLELAEEFRQIGDHDGARDLLQEVVAQASGPLKSRAQGMLDSLV